MTDVLIKRELLERLATECEAETEWNCANVPAGTRAATTRAIAMKSVADELRAILAAPRQPEGDHGWLVSLELPEVQCNCAWNPDSHEKTCPVYLRDRMADAKRAIAELREECKRLRKERDGIANSQRYGQDAVAISAERDTLRQQLAERDAEIERLRVKLMTIASAEPGRHNIEWAKAMAATGNNESYAKWREAFDQRDKLADILRDLVPGCKWRFMRPRIDAALAEIDHDNE